jgi:hypothetical protein
MNSREVHIVGAGIPGASDSILLACAERLAVSPGALGVLVARSGGEVRSRELGLRTSHVLPALERFASGGFRRWLATHGSRFDHVFVWNESLLAPVANSVRRAGGRWYVNPVRLEELSPRRVPSSRRADLRTRLSLEGDDFVIMLGADPAAFSSAHDFIRACALVALAGRPVTAVLPCGTPETDRAKEAIRSTGIAVRIVTVRCPIWAVLPASDAIFVHVHEGNRPRVVDDFALRWMAMTGVQLGIPTVWPGGPVEFPHGQSLIRADSPRPLHVARALTEYLAMLPPHAAPTRQASDRLVGVPAA